MATSSAASELCGIAESTVRAVHAAEAWTKIIGGWPRAWVMHSDASAAIDAIRRGWSPAFVGTRASGIDLAWLNQMYFTRHFPGYGLRQLHKVATTLNLADLFTKCLPREALCRLLDLLYSRPTRPKVGM